MKKSKVLLSLTGTVLALSMLAVPAAAHSGGHHGGGHHGGTAAAAATTAVYCGVCGGAHDKGDCPNYCGDCGYSHTGDCTAHTATGHHKSHGCR